MSTFLQKCCSLHRQHILFLELLSKLLLPQKLQCLNDSRPGGGREHSLQPHLQHPNKALVRVTWVLYSDGLHGGHGQMEVDANEFPLVCHCVVEGIHQVFHFWCWSYTKNWSWMGETWQSYYNKNCMHCWL